MNVIKAIWVGLVNYVTPSPKEKPQRYLDMAMGQNKQPPTPPPFQVGGNFSDIRWDQGVNACPSVELNQVPRTPACVRLPLPIPTYYDELVLAGMFDGESEIAVNAQWWLWVDRQNRRLKISPYPKNSDRPSIIVDTLGATSLGNLNMPTVEVLSMFSAILAFFRERQAFDRQPDRMKVHRLFRQLVDGGMFELGHNMTMVYGQWVFKIRQERKVLEIYDQTYTKHPAVLELGSSYDGITMFNYMPSAFEHHLDAKAAIALILPHFPNKLTTHKETP